MFQRMYVCQNLLATPSSEFGWKGSLCYNIFLEDIYKLRGGKKLL